MPRIIVVGAGHAGIEAALVAARMGVETILITKSRDSVALMSCNPSLGGPAKGIIVREIGALGGEMARAGDHTMIQAKMLNSSKGPGVRALRVQTDRGRYHDYFLSLLDRQERLTLLEGDVTALLVEDGAVVGVVTAEGPIRGDKVIVTTGTYLESTVLVGHTKRSQGPDGFAPSHGLSASIASLGHNRIRLKTGTPPRLEAASIDFSDLSVEPGMQLTTSFCPYDPRPLPLADQVVCHLIKTTPETKQIIIDNLKESAMYGGLVEGVGPRYCPSIEDKIVRFADKESHQLFLEPEDLSGETIYLQGFSTSMPYQIQEQLVHSLPGLSRARIVKYAYAIEYDAFDPRQLRLSLESKLAANLYLAGQINGTSGYEEAAGQGLLAGVNAVRALQGREPIVLKRHQAYIGVLIDDLVTKGVLDPYRMLTSRAEHRLLLRHDNVVDRLFDTIKEIGVVSEQNISRFNEQFAFEQRLVERLATTRVPGAVLLGHGFEADPISCLEALARPPVGLVEVLEAIGIGQFDIERMKAVEIALKYKGYIDKELREIQRRGDLEAVIIPADFDYQALSQMALEARAKLERVRPVNLLQASRISGVNPGDIALLHFYLRRKK